MNGKFINIDLDKRRVSSLSCISFYHSALQEFNIRTINMSRPQLLLLLWLQFLLLLSELFHSSHGDVGTSAHYSPPYLPTACYGNDASQFPSSNLFGSAGEGIWDNGAACGRQYLVRCLSASAAKTCVAGKIIQIKIVDRAATSVSRPSMNGATMVLSDTAFQAIANRSASSVNVEFQQM